MNGTPSTVRRPGRQRRPAADRLGMGAGGRLRRLRRRRRERGPHQPGGHPGPGRQAGVPVEQGGAVHGGPGAGGVRRGALVYLVYHDAISSFEAAKHITRGTLGGAADSTPTFSIFVTFPAPYFGSSHVGPLIDQIVGTAFLLMFVLALPTSATSPQ